MTSPSLHERISAHAVALTFDDGPDPVATPAVLEQLAGLGVTATFFVVGHRVRRHPELVRAIEAGGHALASHSERHLKPWATPLSEVVEDYTAGRETLEDLLGREVTLFRPPYGWATEASLAHIEQLGLNAWKWSLDPEDWIPGRTTEEILEVAVALRGGDVVLLHDGVEGPEAPEALNRSSTIRSVEPIVELARARGLGLVPLPL